MILKEIANPQHLTIYKMIILCWTKMQMKYFGYFFLEEIGLSYLKIIA